MMNKEELLKKAYSNDNKTAGDLLLILCDCIKKDFYFEIPSRDAKTLFNHIMDLYEKIENLTTFTVCGDIKQIKSTAQYKLEKAQEKIDKATECIKILREKYFKNCVWGSNNDFGELLEILGGKE